MNDKIYLEPYKDEKGIYNHRSIRIIRTRDTSKKIKEMYQTLKLYCKIVNIFPCTFNLRGPRKLLNLEIIESLREITDVLETSKNTLESFITFYSNSSSYKYSIYKHYKDLQWMN